MPYAVLLLVLVLTPWFWFIVKVNPLILLVLVIFNFLLLFSLIKLSGRIINAIVAALFAILILFNLQQGFDKSISAQSIDQNISQNKRHGYYSASLGKLYTNKISIYYYTKISRPFTKLQKNLFSTLDLNLYFFGSSPRERTDVSEFEKYSFLMMPFFLVGIYAVVKKRMLSVKLYFIAAILASSVINANYLLGPVLFFPLINTVITLGFLAVIRRKIL